jgi:hypothetical protein
MVLFNDMEEYKKPSKFGRIMKWAFRILIVLICLALFFIGSLNLLQGTGEAQRNGLSSALGELTRMKADIGRLQTFELFPHLIIEAADIRFEDRETAKPKILIENISFTGPGSIIFTKNNIFNAMTIENMRFLKNGLTSLSIDRVFIEESEEENFLQAIGNLDGESFTAMMPLESWVSKRDGNRYFKFKEGFPFLFKMSDTDIQGALVANDDGNMIVFAKGQFAGEQASCILAKPETAWLGLNLNDFYMKTTGGNTITGQAQVRPEAGIVLLGDEVANIESLGYDFSQIDEACAL